MLRFGKLTSRIGSRAGGPTSLTRANGWRSLSANAKVRFGKDNLSNTKAIITLADGTVLEGISFGAEKGITGEVVFTTGMVGYPESLTDPSFRGQIITLTYPMVGNYGVPRNETDKWGLPRTFESNQIQAAGLIVQDYAETYSHWDAEMSLSDWLKKEGIPGVHGIDTRMLTKKIRATGAIVGKIEFGESDGILPVEDPNTRHLVAEVSRKDVKVYGKGNPHKILAVDCGMKANIIRMLCERGAEAHVVPYNFPIDEHLDEYDGVFLSNGPGDPAMCVETIEELKKVISREGDRIRPLFGICLGNQLMGLAAGAETIKLPFGNRGHNQPVINALNGDCYITPQNHGFAVEDKTLPKEWEVLFTNNNDGSNEGIRHTSKPFFTAQFHPEAQGGPTDTAFLFDVFLENVKNKTRELVFPPRKDPAVRSTVKKVLLLGSGGLSIGQAGEFDYSGAQAIKALKEEGVEVILMNPNIASVQTNVKPGSVDQADQVFFLPVTPEYVEQIIKRERPDGILISMGGQTGLNCGVELERRGILEKYGVQVMGTSVEAVMNTEDRGLFNERLTEIDEKIAPSDTATSVEQAKKVASQLGYPVMIRAAYTLGGLGSGICADEDILVEKTKIALSMSPQILVEKSLLGWKELEYEVVRDAADNCITVCNMENFDPLGVHTGDSIVLAPSQTLSNREYHMLRETAIKVVRKLNIVGECNIQYALDPVSLDYCIIEVNPRLSRSSALASKATGYPLASVAAKLALGITLPEITNSVTGCTQACFEPSLDYVVTKVPRWDLGKFENVSQKIGTAMKSVGEVMAIGRTWEESMQKALRMVDPNIKGFQAPETKLAKNEVIEELRAPTDKRIFAIAQVLESGEMSHREIMEESSIDPWFLSRLQRVADLRKELKGLTLPDLDHATMLSAKQLGFSDVQLSQLLSKDGAPVGDSDVRTARLNLGIKPLVKQIDTLAAEYPAQTNYLYMTYHGSEDDIGEPSQSRIVLGSGCYRIGSSVEFDWCGVSTIRTLRALGYKSTMINYNPETVSTDYDECDQLYFDELSKERVTDIYEREQSKGVVVSMGGQIPNNLALPLHEAGVKVMGTCPTQIDRAENREKFSSIIDDLGIQQAQWAELTGIPSALKFAERVGFPVLVRPSYVLSGAAMNVANTADDLVKYLQVATDMNSDFPIVISEFIVGGREIEMDGVARNGEIKACAIHEHIENAGVHSGDANLMLPAQNVSEFTKARIEENTIKIVKELNITGPFNIQYIAKDSDVMCIECNLRASRSFPFVSKTMGVDFIEAATKLMVDEDVSDMDLPNIGTRNRPANYVGVKAPMFSYTRLGGADPVLGVEMASTGEVACFGADVHEAYLKALMSTGFKLPEKQVAITVQKDFLEEVVHEIWLLHSMGYELLATAETQPFLEAKGIPCKLAPYTSAKTGNTIRDSIADKEVDLVVNIGTSSPDQANDNYESRRSAVDFNVPLLTNPQLFKMFVQALDKHKRGEIQFTSAESLFDYYAKEKADEAWTKPTEFH